MTQAQAKDSGFERSDGAPEEYAGYEVLDPMGHNIGRVEKLYFNGNGGPEYVEVRIGLLFTKRVLIPVQDVALDRTAQSLRLK